MSVFLTDVDLTSLVASGQLDLAEILSCDDIRFWYELYAGKELRERSLIHRPAYSTVGELLKEIGAEFASQRWKLDVYPEPYRGFDSSRFSKPGTRTISELGISAGSTLRIIFPAGKRK